MELDHLTTVGGRLGRDGISQVCRVKVLVRQVDMAYLDSIISLGNGVGQARESATSSICHGTVQPVIIKRENVTVHMVGDHLVLFQTLDQT